MAGCFCPIGTVDNNGTCIDPLLCPDSQGNDDVVRVLYVDRTTPWSGSRSEMSHSFWQNTSVVPGCGLLLT